MANVNVNIISVTANNFADWIIRDNNLANTINELRNGNFYKDGGNFTLATGALISLATSGTMLQLAADALIGGTTTMGNQITTNNASIFGNVLMKSALNVAGPILFNANDASYQLTWNGDATVNNLIVKGNTTTVGTQVLSTDTLVLRYNVATVGSGWVNVHRGAANTEASLRWTEANGVWEMINVASNIYYGLLSTQNISDVVTSAALGNVGSANAVKTAYDRGTTAYTQANNAYARANLFAVVANGTAIVANAGNVNFNNTATVNVSVTANGTQANVAFNANAAAIAGPAFDQANLAYAAANSAAGGGLQTTGGTMTGNIKMTIGANITTPTLASVREACTNANALSSPYSANLANTNIFDLTVSVANLTITFINAAAAGNVMTATLVLRQPSTTANGFTMSNTVKWSNGEIPVLSSGIANKADILTFMTLDGGTTFYGAHSMANI